MLKISAVGLFCCDKFEETPKQKVIDLSKLQKIYFSPSFFNMATSKVYANSCFKHFILCMQVSSAVSHSQSIPPPPLHKGGTTTNNNSSTPTTSEESEASPSSVSALTSLAASVASPVSPLVTSSCFTPSAAAAAVATSGFGRDFRDFGLGGISAASRHHSSTLDRYPYLSQTS